MRSPNTNTGLAPSLQSIKISFYLINLVEHSAAADEQQFALGRRDDSPVGAVQQGAAHLLLKGA